MHRGVIISMEESTWHKEVYLFHPSDDRNMKIMKLIILSALMGTCILIGIVIEQLFIFLPMGHFL
jgi:hypothetical protein